MICRAQSILAGIATCIAVALPATAQNKPIFIDLGAGVTPGSVTGDGQVITATSGGGNFRWTQAGGLSALGGNAISAVAISDDGSRISGGIVDGEGKSSAGVWLGGTSWQALGPLGATGCDASLSSTYDVSGDGSKVVGLGWLGCQAHAFSWSEDSGMVDLGTLFASRSTRANGADYAGDVIVGWQDLTNGQRVAARWVDGVESLILGPSGQYSGEAYDVTADGSLIVGLNCGYAGTQAWTWDASTGLHCVSGLNNLFATSADGSVMGGGNGAGPSMQAMIRLGTTVSNLKTWLVGQGVSGPGAWIGLTAVLDISADGSVLVGWGQKSQPFPAVQGWVVVLELAPPKLVLGKGPTATDLSWSRVTGSNRSDLIRGDLLALLSTGGDFAVATEACLLNSTSLLGTTDSAPDPAAGDGYWYLVRAEGTGNQGTYDESGPGQVGSRDVEIGRSPFACP
jgi:probable HAF family extracellular repeat protein